MANDCGDPLGSAYVHTSHVNVIIFQQSFRLLSGLVLKVNGELWGPSPITLWPLTCTLYSVLGDSPSMFRFNDVDDNDNEG